jgi:hypothetical protein
MLAAVAVFALAACGGGKNADNHHDNDPGHNHENGHHHDDEHGEAHELGHKDLEGGYHVMASLMGEMHDVKEAVFEIQVLKDKKPVKDASVTAWITHGDGEVSAEGTAEWREDESAYDCHVRLSKNPGEGAQLMIRIGHGGKKLETYFDLPKDEH